MDNPQAKSKKPQPYGRIVHSMDRYKYDLAISLLDEDREAGQKIHDRLSKEGFEVFFYLESQKDIAFREGTEKLSNVYRSRSRAVLMLLRSRWGTTKWTAIEKDAIKTRRYDEGASFLMSVAMEPMEIPDWIPKNFFYHEYKKWPADILMGAIIGKLGELNAEVKELTAVELANQHAQAEEWDNTHYSKLNGVSAKSHAEAERGELLRILQESIVQINKAGRGVMLLQGGVGNRCITISRKPCSIHIVTDEDHDERPYVHQLRITEFDGMVDGNGYRATARVPVEQKVTVYAIDVDQADNWFWRNTSSKQPMTTARLADTLLKMLLTRSAKFESGELTYQPPPPEPDDDDDMWDTGTIIFSRY